ncbi:MarR family winged helix-turn-helix transcriptional regulator [Rhodoligotrophos defluvii]|uniref:MarR family winged helix-turn-helix transcriptional regulator n=1 Tax=Rhodoligotrophos defluvii TaxID=2561934 RepID=UPI0010CA076E|nr:MarR family transcriptional regulator [Rhodoligotrophos defluvii]
MNAESEAKTLNGQAADQRLRDVRDLFSFQLQRLAALSSRIAVLSIGPRYRLTVLEWRALAVLDYLGQAPLQKLATHSGLLKSQMSRTVSGLIQRGLISRSENPEDGRSILLRLTGAGKDVVTRILADSEMRNENMLADLSPEERAQLQAALKVVFATSLAYYDRLRSEVSSADAAAFGFEP